MLDIRLIRDHPELVERSLARRQDEASLESIIAADEARRELVQRVDELRAERNEASRRIGEAKRRGDDAEEQMQAVRELGETLAAAEHELREADARLEAQLVQLPNIVADDVPDGGEEASAELRSVGQQPTFDFDVRDHLDLGTSLGIIDMERAARTSGSRFAYLLGDAARLQYALVQLALDRLGSRGFIPVVPPVLVREEAMWGTGFFPTDRNQIYRTELDELYLVGTSEVPLAALHMEEILDADELPLRYAGVSSCFRREAGAAGKDTRGIFRVHQFDKVEMFSFTRPEDSADEHEFMVSCEEQLLGELGLHYRVINIAAGDLGASAAKKYDLEAWLPSQERYRELTSCSNCTDYQARRLRAPMRRAGEKQTEFVHTLNGTAIAIGRMLIALLETHQQADGSVAVPECLHAFGAPTVLAPGAAVTAG